MREPKLLWTPEELAELPAVYAQMILREHERAVLNHRDKVRWQRQRDKEKRDKDKKKAEDKKE